MPIIIAIVIAAFAFMAICGLSLTYTDYRAVKRYIEGHAAVFARKRSQLLVTDDYGLEKPEAWHRELIYITTKVMPKLLNIRQPGVRRTAHYAQWIEDVAVEHQRTHAASLTTVATGVDYEHFCANLLRKAGWQARVTQASGDQGVDVVAENGGRRAVLQCKFYGPGRTVGNGAVQEVFAAKSHEQADIAAVVTNVPFTRSAQQLASTTGVLLLHHDELPNFAH